MDNFKCFFFVICGHFVAFLQPSLRKSSNREKNTDFDSKRTATENNQARYKYQCTPKMQTTGMAEYFNYMKDEGKKTSQIRQFNLLTVPCGGAFGLSSSNPNSPRSSIVVVRRKGMNAGELKKGHKTSRSHGNLASRKEGGGEGYQTMAVDKFRDTENYIRKVNTINDPPKSPGNGKLMSKFFG